MNIEKLKAEIDNRIKSENDLLHQRMTWLGTFQGLLFGATAFAWDKNSAQAIVFLACCVGFLVSVSLGYAIYRTNIAIEKTSAYWDKIRPQDYEQLDSEGYRSKSPGAWLMPGRFVPKVFAVTWIFIFVISYCK